MGRNTNIGARVEASFSPAPLPTELTLVEAFENQSVGGSGMQTVLRHRLDPGSGAQAIGDGVEILHQGDNSVGGPFSYSAYRTTFDAVISGSELATVSIAVADGAGGERVVFTGGGGGLAGVGIAVPDGAWHIHEASAGAATATATGNTLVVESDGNMGMSFLAPATASQNIFFGRPGLEVQGAISYNQNNDSLAIHTNATLALTIDSSGNVGIGTSAPDADIALHVLTGTGSVSTGFGAGTVAGFQRSGTGEAARIAVMAAPDSDSSLYLGDTASVTAGRVVYENSTDSMGLYTAETERITINSAGNVGIGVDPAVQLHVQKNQNTSTVFQLQNATAGTAAHAQIRLYSDTAEFYLNSYSGSYTTSGINIADSVTLLANNASQLNIGIQGATQPLTFWTNSAERMRINSSGNVGIGTTTPTSPGSIETFLHISSPDHAGLILEDTSHSPWTMWTQNGELMYSYSSTEYMKLQAGGHLHTRDFGTYEVGTSVGATHNIQIYPQEKRAVYVWILHCSVGGGNQSAPYDEMHQASWHGFLWRDITETGYTEFHSPGGDGVSFGDRSIGIGSPSAASSYVNLQATVGSNTTGVMKIMWMGYLQKLAIDGSTVYTTPT